MVSTSTPSEQLDHVSMATLAAVERFNAAFGRRDIDAIMATMTEDCLFDNTAPPDGQIYRGSAQVRAFWEQFFAGSPGARFDAEEIFAAGDRCVVRWRYSWQGAGGEAGHVRGVDLFRVRDGRVAEKLAYVKG